MDAQGIEDSLQHPHGRLWSGSGRVPPPSGLKPAFPGRALRPLEKGRKQGHTCSRQCRARWKGRGFLLSAEKGGPTELGTQGRLGEAFSPLSLSQLWTMD